MNDQREPEIILYDLASQRAECFSPVVWRTRILLNSQKIAYRTVFLDFVDIQPAMQSLGLEPASVEQGKPRYTVPVIHHLPTGVKVMDSQAIAEFLAQQYPALASLTRRPGAEAAEVMAGSRATLGPALEPWLRSRELTILLPRGAAYFRARYESDGFQGASELGIRMEQWIPSDAAQEDAWWHQRVSPGLQRLGDALTATGAQPWVEQEGGEGMVDVFLVAFLASTKAVDAQGVFTRMMTCAPLATLYRQVEVKGWLDKKD